MANCDKIERKLLRELDTMKAVHKQTLRLRKVAEKSIGSLSESLEDDLNNYNEMLCTMAFGLTKIKKKINTLRDYGRTEGLYTSHPMYGFVTDGSVEEFLAVGFQSVIEIYKELYSDEKEYALNLERREEEVDEEYPAYGFGSILYKVYKSGELKIVEHINDFDVDNHDGFMDDDYLCIKKSTLFEIMDKYYNVDLGLRNRFIDKCDELGFVRSNSYTPEVVVTSVQGKVYDNLIVEYNQLSKEERKNFTLGEYLVGHTVTLYMIPMSLLKDEEDEE